MSASTIINITDDGKITTATVAVPKDDLIGAIARSVRFPLLSHPITLTDYMNIYANGGTPSPMFPDYERAADTIIITMTNDARISLRDYAKQVAASS